MLNSVINISHSVYSYITRTVLSLHRYYTIPCETKLSTLAGVSVSNNQKTNVR